MNIHYHLSQFISHARAGADNMRALEAAGHTLVASPVKADLVVLHDEPPYWAGRFKNVAAPVVAYCVVETDPMPPSWVEPLRGVSEIWTCSEFSRSILARELDEVCLVPHVVRRPHLARQDLKRVRELVGEAADTYTFYTICDGANPRKNLPALLRAFARAAGSSRHGRYRLVVKQYRHALDLSGLPGVVSISERLTEGEMAALHAACDCYVSAHAAEAWGLGLSEAMAFGNPVVATGYSGNMEFMNEGNALPVRFALERIRAADLRRCPPFFTPGMRWAYVDEDDLAAAMLRARSMDPVRLRNAASISQAYGEPVVGRIMDNRIQALVERPDRAVGA